MCPWIASRKNKGRKKLTRDLFFNILHPIVFDWKKRNVILIVSRMFRCPRHLSMIVGHKAVCFLNSENPNWSNEDAFSALLDAYSYIISHIKFCFLLSFIFLNNECFIIFGDYYAAVKSQIANLKKLNLVGEDAIAQLLILPTPV